MVRVVFELTDISKNDGATHFIAGSHKSNFPMHPDHMSLEDGKRSPFLMNYECPAGSAIFFTENLCHAGPVWQRNTPRVGSSKRVCASRNALAPPTNSAPKCSPPYRVKSRHTSANLGLPISARVRQRLTRLIGF